MSLVLRGEIVDGPSLSGLGVSVFGLNAGRKKEVYPTVVFKLKATPWQMGWLNKLVETSIHSVSRIGNDSWQILGNVVDGHDLESLFQFSCEYSIEKRRGQADFTYPEFTPDSNLDYYFNLLESSDNGEISQTKFLCSLLFWLSEGGFCLDSVKLKIPKINDVSDPRLQHLIKTVLK